jgi:uncharacterized protein (DUF952 family)
MDMIVHICKMENWDAAWDLGEYWAESLKVEGFIHCSRPGQVLKVANTYYPEGEDLGLLWIDLQRLTAELKWEDSDGDVFPHLYGPLNLDAVAAFVDFPHDSDGVFRTVPKSSLAT